MSCYRTSAGSRSRQTPAQLESCGDRWLRSSIIIGPLSAIEDDNRYVGARWPNYGMCEYVRPLTFLYRGNRIPVQHVGELADISAILCCHAGVGRDLVEIEPIGFFAMNYA
jgi:hypothetical protein